MHEKGKPIQFKKGATLNATCSLRASSGLTSLTGVTIASSILTKNGIRHDCVVTIPDVTKLKFNARIQDTSDFVEGSALWDFKFVLNGVIVYSDTEELTIVKNITP